MAAQDDKQIICDFCFAENTGVAEFCVECGAPLSEGGAEASDAQVYPLLTKANLQRLRADYEAARATCMEILRQYPNNATTQALLGDILVEQKDFAHAIEWYDMALDVRPSDDAVRAKRANCQESIRAAEVAAQHDQLAITPAPKTGWYAAGVALIVVAVGIGSFMFGQGRAKAAETNQPLVMAPIENQPETNVSTDNQAAPEEDVPPLENPSSSAPIMPGQEILEDTGRRTALSGMIPEGNRLRQLMSDPRGPHWTLIIDAQPSDNTDTIGLIIGIAALKSPGAPRSVTVMVHRNGILDMVAEMNKSEVDAIGDQPPTPDLLKSAWRTQAAATADPTLGQGAP
ncbi:MAG: tetratricopeptide repeat protein [Fimbriimonadaceae bacterium]|nr:tetratricopeptide repeat protein [Fimbriimonadaceae bacterium]